MTRRNAYLAPPLRRPAAGAIRSRLRPLLLALAVVPAVTLPAALSSAPSLAAGTALDSNRELQACAARAEADPESGIAAAKRWREQGGGDHARLCEALALFHKGDFKTAGAELEALVPLLAADDPKAAASLLGRAGWAWLRAGDSARAERLYGEALAKTPGDVDLLIDRAFARAEAERFWDALADLDAALAQAPRRAEAYLYRATAHKALSNYRQALADIDQALVLKPADPEAILMRGNIKALSGNLLAARDDWALVRRVAPESDWGRAAADNLDRTVKAAEAAGKDAAAKDPAKDPAKDKGKTAP